MTRRKDYSGSSHLRRRKAARRNTRLILEQLEERAMLAGELMRYQIRVVPPNGALFQPDPGNSSALIATPNLTSVNVGEQYDLVITVQDLRPGDPTNGPANGVGAAWMDVIYDSSKTRVVASEIQRITIGTFGTGGASPQPGEVGGSFTLTFNGQTTGVINYNPNAATLAALIQTGLRNLPTVNGPHIDVTADTNDPTKFLFNVRFTGKYLDQNVNPITVASSLTSPGNAVQATVSYEGDLINPANPPNIAFTEAFRSRGVQTITSLQASQPNARIYYPNGLTAGNVINANPALSRIDDVGAFGDNVPPLPGLLTSQELAAGFVTVPPRELVRARFTATRPGPLTFTPDLTQRNLPQHDALLYDRPGGLPLTLAEMDPGNAVSLFVNAVDLMEYQLRIVGPGAPLFEPDPANFGQTRPLPDLTTVAVGQEYDVVITGLDLRPNGKGVFAGFMDITYNSSLTQVQASEFQRIVISGQPTGGSFRLNYGGTPTANINFSGIPLQFADNIRIALSASGLAGANNVQVTPDTTDPLLMQFVVKYVGTLRGQDVPNVTLDAGGNNLTGGTSPAVNIIYESDLASGIPPASFLDAWISRGTPTIAGVPTGRIYYPNQPSAGNVTNRIDDVGAVGANEAPYPGEPTPAELTANIFIVPPREIARARFKATAAGTITFTPDLTDLTLPAHHTLMFDRDTELAFSTTDNLSEIKVGPAKQLSVVLVTITSGGDSATVDEDSAPNPIDVLSNDAANPPGGTKNVVSVTQGTNGTVTFTATNVSYQPNPNFFGTDTFTYEVRNISAGPSSPTTTGTVSVTVNPVNDPPTLNGLGSLVVNEDAPAQVVNLSGIASGAPNESQTLTVTATSDNPTIIPNPQVTYTSANSTGSISFTPLPEKFGNVNIVVTVTDSGAAPGTNFVSQTFSVSVAPINDAPSMDAIPGGSTINEDEPTVLQLTGITAGPSETQTISITAVSSNPTLLPNPVPSYVSPSTNGSLALNPAGNQNGSVTVSVTISDGESSQTITIPVTIRAVNDPPTFVRAADPTAPDENGAQDLPNFASAISVGPPDEVAAGQTYAFVLQSDRPDLFSVPPAIDNNGRLTFTPAPNVEGVATVNLTIGDTGGRSNGGDDDSVQVFQINVTKPHRLYNTRNPRDVNDSRGQTPITALDALNIFNRLNLNVSGGNIPIPPTTPIGQPFFYDVNRNHFVDPLDALIVINELNRLAAGGGEGESAAVDEAFAAAGDEDMGDILALLAADAAEAARRRRRGI
jgi:hypothetical protein